MKKKPEAGNNRRRVENHESRRAARGAGRTGSPVEHAGFTQLQRGLTGERSLIGESYMDNHAMLEAYLAYYWPVSRAQAAHAIGVGYGSGFAGSVRTVIDAGSGPGPVAAAFSDAGAEALCLLDQSRRALDIAFRELPRRCSRLASLSSFVMDISRPDPSVLPLWGKADCVCFGHSLNELFPDDPGRIEKRAALLETYSGGLAPGGKILVIEPALLSTSRDLLAVRNLLVARGWRVAAPCRGRETLPCPAFDAGANHTCHEEISWTLPAGVARLAGSLKLDKESLKMTWFLLVPPQGGDGSHAGEGSPGTVYRVVSDPMLNKSGRVRRLICGEAGRFPLSAEEGSGDARRSGFDLLKRGDFIEVDNPEKRENGWGVGHETRIRRIK